MLSMLVRRSSAYFAHLSYDSIISLDLQFCLLFSFICITAPSARILCPREMIRCWRLLNAAVALAWQGVLCYKFLTCTRLEHCCSHHHSLVALPKAHTPLTSSHVKKGRSRTSRLRLGSSGQDHFIVCLEDVTCVFECQAIILDGCQYNIPVVLKFIACVLQGVTLVCDFGQPQLFHSHLLENVVLWQKPLPLKGRF